MFCYVRVLDKNLSLSTTLEISVIVDRQFAGVLINKMNNQ
jgi:hypothetical protein